MSDPAILRRLDNMLIVAGIVSDSTSGGEHRGQMSGREGEGKTGIRIMTPFGFACRIVPGDEPETVLLAVESNLRYALTPVDPRYAPDDLAAGEAALYNADDADGGCRIHLRRGRVVEITCRQAIVRADDLIRLEADRVQVHARLSYSWDVAGFGESWRFVGGTTWEHKTWQMGATVNPVPLPIHPPEGP